MDATKFKTPPVSDELTAPRGFRLPTQESTIPNSLFAILCLSYRKRTTKITDESTGLNQKKKKTALKYVASVFVVCYSLHAQTLSKEYRQLSFGHISWVFIHYWRQLREMLGNTELLAFACVHRLVGLGP